MPAPSPMTKPSRSLSHGREAFSGSSLRVDNAFIAQKPPTEVGVITAIECKGHTTTDVQSMARVSPTRDITPAHERPAAERIEGIARQERSTAIGDVAHASQMILREECRRRVDLLTRRE